jgi:hypothetical protein
VGQFEKLAHSPYQRLAIRLRIAGLQADVRRVRYEPFAKLSHYPGIGYFAVTKPPLALLDDESEQDDDPKPARRDTGRAGVSAGESSLAVRNELRMGRSLHEHGAGRPAELPACIKAVPELLCCVPSRHTYQGTTWLCV